MGYQSDRGERGNKRTQGHDDWNKKGSPHDVSGYSGGNSVERKERPPLQWKTEKFFRKGGGRLVLVLQKASLENGGSRLSFRIGKESTAQPDKPFPFMDPRDLREARELMDDLQIYLDQEVKPNGN